MKLLEELIEEGNVEEVRKYGEVLIGLAKQFRKDALDKTPKKDLKLSTLLYAALHHHSIQQAEIFATLIEDWAKDHTKFE